MADQCTMSGQILGRLDRFSGPQIKNFYRINDSLSWWFFNFWELANLRICPFYHLNEVEHELHFLFNCNLYDIVFYLPYTETLVTDNPFLVILTKMKKPSSYFIYTMLILNTDLQLLTYIQVLNIDKNLFFNYSLYFDLRFIT